MVFIYCQAFLLDLFMMHVADDARPKCLSHGCSTMKPLLIASLQEKRVKLLRSVTWPMPLVSIYAIGRQDNIWWAINCCFSPRGLLSIITGSLCVCFTWQPVADQTLVWLPPLISQSQILTACLHWQWMQGYVTYCRWTYWCYWCLNAVPIIFVWISWQIRFSTPQNINAVSCGE